MNHARSILAIVIGATFVGGAGAQPPNAQNDKKDHAFTAWAFVFNDPENCLGGVCDDPSDLCPADGAVIYLTGQRVQKNGRATLAGQISADSLHRVIGPGGCPDNGLIDPINSEIHVGIQNHGAGSLEGTPEQNHLQVTTPAGNLIQFAIFLPGAAAGIVTENGVPVPDAAARITRDALGVSISIDTQLDLPANGK